MSLSMGERNNSSINIKFMKISKFLFLFIFISINGYSQSGIDLVEADEYEATEISNSTSNFIGADNELFYCLVINYEILPGSNRKHDYVGYLNAYNLNSLKLKFHERINFPVEGTNKLSIHGGTLLEDGVGVFYSHYNKKTNERILALVTLDQNGKISSDIKRLFSTKGITEKWSSMISVHQEPNGNNSLIIERYPSNPQIGTVKSNIRVLRVNNKGAVDFEHALTLGKKKSYGLEIIEATEKGNLLIRRKSQLNYRTIMIHVESGTVHELPETKEEFGKDFLYNTPLAIFDLPDGKSVCLGKIEGPVKKYSRTIGYRCVTMDESGNLVDTKVIPIEIDDPLPKDKISKSRPALRKFKENFIQLDGDKIQIIGTRADYMPRIDDLMSIRLNIIHGGIERSYCERSAVISSYYIDVNPSYYGKNGKYYIIGNQPEMWINEGCGNTTFIPKKDISDVEFTGVIQSVERQEFSNLEELNYNNKKIKGLGQMLEIVNLNGRFLGVIADWENGKIYFSWLPY
jgi:hypothetical protein